MLLIAFYFCWILTFGLVLWRSNSASEIADYGMPSNLNCGNTFFVPGNSCGLNGNNCRPFNGTDFVFRCPAECKKTMVLEPRAVGDQEVLYQPLVIGGPPEGDSPGYYRADSFVCSAAIHAGVINNKAGGCGVLTLSGPQKDFPASKKHGIQSIEFDSYFPSSFIFQKELSCNAKDLRWPLLAVSLAFSIVFSLFVSGRKLFFFTIFTALFAHTGLASDPPVHSSLTDLLSNLLGKFLPAVFCAFVMYRYMGVRRSLTGLTAQIEKTVLWLGGCWIGALTNYTFDFIPIQRLNAHDINQQPGAKLALAIVIMCLAFIFFQQAYYFWLEGRFLPMLGLYALFIGSILLSLAIPGLNLRIHHYILALLLLPGTSMQTRPALLYQGILVGLFINGIARWGFDPVLQTPDALRGDAQFHSELPTILEPIISLGMNISTITFNWETPPSPFDGISVLVNDVERFRGYGDEGFTNEPFTGSRFSWIRDANLGMPEYFRFAYMEGSRTWDYTKAGVWGADGGWTQMKPGPSL